jgi:hypothetical protein
MVYVAWREAYYGREFNPGDTESMGNLFQPWHIIIFLFVLPVVAVIFFTPYWQIFKKAGFAPRSASSCGFL